MKVLTVLYAVYGALGLFFWPSPYEGKGLRVLKVFVYGVAVLVFCVSVLVGLVELF